MNKIIHVPLNFDLFREANLKRCVDPKGFKHRLEAWSSLEWAGAMCGEAGEAANVAKKMIRIRDGVAGNRAGDEYIALRDRLGREVADTVIYADLVCTAHGLFLSEQIMLAWNQKSQNIKWPYRFEL